MKSYFTVFCILMFFASSIAQDESKRKNHEQIPVLRRLTTHDPNFVKTTEKSFYQLKNGWQAIIDSTWGPGLPLQQKLNIFDTYAIALTNAFDGFLSLGLDFASWDSLRLHYRGQINDSTSRGGFSALMNYLSNDLRDIHTIADDDEIIFLSPLNPGIPVLFAFGFTTVEHFGAVVTTLPDSSVLVLRVVANHPLGLQPGDIILGYEGVPYKTLVNELMNAKLPCWSPRTGSQSAYDHHLMIGAGMNWHLFNTIDILQYSTGNTLNLSTAPMINLSVSPMLNNEQLAMQGIPFPDYFNEQLVSYGIINNTNIGYIYLFSEWPGNTANQQFYQAVNALKNTEGLIIDMRWNEGGSPFANFNNAFEILFNESHFTLNGANRCNSSTLNLCPNNRSNIYRIEGNPSSIYDHPIAILLGPTCVSMGDNTAHKFRYHPMVKFLGKSPAASLGANLFINSFPDWFLRYSIEDKYHLNNPGIYLNRSEFPIDFPVWHNPDDAANGIDAVVESAKSWIHDMSYTYDLHINKIFVRALTDTLTITANVANPNNHNIDPAIIINTLDSVFVDSLPLFDDGNHGDSLAGDGLYGTFLNPLSSEDIFTISGSVTDLDSNHYHILQNAAHFTTIGPVVFESDSDSLVDYFGSSYKLFFKLRNDGLLAPAKNVTAEISTTDSAVTSIVNNSGGFGDIEAGQIKASTGYYTLYTSNLDSIHTLKFSIRIFSYGYEYWQDTTDVLVGLSEKKSDIPKIYSLSQNYPNPFNPRTNIQFSIPKAEFVSLRIYNLLGQEVATLVSDKLTSGNYKYEWDASSLASGVYLYNITAGDFVQTRKMILLR